MKNNKIITGVIIAAAVVVVMGALAFSLNSKNLQGYLNLKGVATVQTAPRTNLTLTSEMPGISSTKPSLICLASQNGQAIPTVLPKAYTGVPVLFTAKPYNFTATSYTWWNLGSGSLIPEGTQSTFSVTFPRLTTSAKVVAKAFGSDNSEIGGSGTPSECDIQLMDAVISTTPSLAPQANNVSASGANGSANLRSAVTMLSPAGNMTIKISELDLKGGIEFKWSPVAGALKYDLMLQKSGTGTAKIYSTSGSSFTVPASDLQAGTVTWFVRAFYPTGERTDDPVSAYTFVISGS